MNPDTIDKLESSDNEQRASDKMPESWVGRQRHFLAKVPVDSWNWYLMPMTTLGLSTLVHAQTDIKNFHGLWTWGLVIYFIGLVEYFLVVILKTNKALLKGRNLLNSLSNPSEALFFATFWIATYGLITASIDFAAPAPTSNLALTFLVFFWLYFVGALVSVIGMHVSLAHAGTLEQRDMTPAWLLPEFPMILTGVMAGSLAPCLTEKQAFPVLIAGLLCSSMGFLVALPMFGLYFFRLLTIGLPVPDKRPAMMIAVGPPSYAPLAFLKLAASVPVGYAVFAEIPTAAIVCEVLALIFGVAIIGMAIFFFLFAFACISVRAKFMSFHMTWYGFIFPNVGLLSLAGILGLQIPSQGLQWVVSIFTLLLFLVWLFVSGMHARALILKKDAF